MTQKELLPLFPSNCYVANQILLVPPSEFGKLEGHIIDGSHMFILICNGNLKLELNDKQYEIKAHSFIDIMEMITVRIDKFSPDLQAWGLSVTFDFASESLKNLRPGPQNNLLERLHIFIQNFSKEECSILEQQLKLLESSLHDVRHHYRQELIKVYFKSFSLELGNTMFAHEKKTNDTPPYITKRDFITLDFMKLVSKHFTTEHNVEFYANALYISSKHLTRIIKEKVGKTPHKVICDELIHHAMAMLEDDKISVGQIAEELHFSDQAAFCKFFKKRMKISPMAYRKKL